MITYSLAKELKEAGFPQTPPRELYCLTCKKWREVGCLQSDMAISDRHERETIKVPTLSELIEACGHTYTENGKEYKFMLLYSIDAWFAGYSDDEFERPILADGKGSIPEEAVARLWLALNKKS